MKKSTKRKIVRKFGEITIDLLELIANIPVGIIGGFVDHHGVYSYVQRDDNILDNFFIRLRSLQERGYIEIKSDGKNKSVRLTNKGKIKVLEGKKSKIRDGKWRILSFDVPREKNKLRDQFRRSIKRIGFKQVQQSLWVSPFINADEIDLIIDELKIREYVAYFIIDKTDIEEHLEIMFEKEFRTPKPERW
ncbi:MAG: hypothetical protein NTW79_00630 [Candidatus Berkelbacteria bacterium]|nr:hypothetical protein [Candidatus Berkelbacteria bacterium]